MGELKVLILGDGLLGSEIHKQTGWNYISRKAGTLDIDSLAMSLNPHSANINVIVNCIANTNTYSKDKELHWKTNCVFVHNLVRYCNNNGIKLIHISTDYLYTGSISNASEEDVPVHCPTWYGYTKLMGDGLVQLHSLNYLICRCTHKPYPFPYEGAWIDQVGNFDYVNVIASLIIDLVKSNAEGVYNVGTETKTMHELASTSKLVYKTFTPEHVPKNQSMDITKMKKQLKQ